MDQKQTQQISDYATQRDLILNELTLLRQQKEIVSSDVASLLLTKNQTTNELSQARNEIQSIRILIPDTQKMVEEHAKSIRLEIQSLEEQKMSILRGMDNVPTIVQTIIGDVAYLSKEVATLKDSLRGIAGVLASNFDNSIKLNASLQDSILKHSQAIKDFEDIREEHNQLIKDKTADLDAISIRNIAWQAELNQQRETVKQALVELQQTNGK